VIVWDFSFYSAELLTEDLLPHLFHYMHLPFLFCCALKLFYWQHCCLPIVKQKKIFSIT